MADLGKKVNYEANTQGNSDYFMDLWQEYRRLVETLREQGKRRDVALEMRLTVVMMDLGMYQPSPP